MTNRDETPLDTDNTPIEGSPFTPRQVRILKIAVVVMGVLLVGGFLLIIGTIAFQASQMGVEKAAAPVTSETARSPAEGAREAFDVSIPEGAEIAGMAVDGNRLVLRLTTREGGQIMVVDLSTGAVLSRIQIRTQ